MPFFAIVEAATGDIIDVLESLDEALPGGAIAIELPAKDDDLRRWLAQHRKDRGGGNGGDELFLDRTESAAADKHGGRRDELSDAEFFFRRLDHEVQRAEVQGRQVAVLLFELLPIDRVRAHEFVVDELARYGQELLPCDLVSRLRDHLAGVLLPDTDGAGLRITPSRGAVSAMTYPRDHEQIELLRRRRHPLLRSVADRVQRRTGL